MYSGILSENLETPVVDELSVRSAAAEDWNSPAVLWEDSSGRQ